MSIFLQILLGLVPITLLFLLLSIFKKQARARNIVMSVLLVCMIITMGICALTVKPEDEGVKSEKDKVTQIDLIYSVASRKGGTAKALELLRDLRATANDSAEITLCDAYLNASAGDWRSAELLYNKAMSLSGKKPSGEFAELCKKAREETNTDYAAAVYFGEEVSSEQDSCGKLVLLANKFIDTKAKGLDKEIRDSAAILVESEELFGHYLEAGELDQGRVKYLVSSLDEAAEANPSLLNIEPVRICRLKLNVLAGKYSSVAGSITKSSCYDELAIASELYINGLISDSAFSKDYTGDYKKMSREVLAQLEKLYEDLPSDKKEDKELVKELIEKLKGKKATDGLDILKDGILAVAADKESPDSPKAYLQLAKIEYREKDENKSKRYISKALSGLGISDDEEFYIPLSNIARVITDKDDKEELKNVAGYVDEAINHSGDSIVIAAVEKAAAQNDPGDDDTKSGSAFNGFMNDAVSQLRISVNITDVDSSDFPTVKATVTIDESLAYTAEELKSMISVTDCGVEIEDFTVEKVEYKAANILLCCDTSGSMSGQPIEDLSNAVKLFVDTSKDKERIALVTFDSNIEDVYDFGTDKDTIYNAADSFNASGGTNMYDAIIDSLDKFSKKEGELNYILLLSDGEDGTIRSSEKINENIGIPCIDKAVVLYSLGLGSDVNIDYMDTLAISTNGEFVYISDSATLGDFYDTLRGQILNQYIVTYKAEDTLTVNRNVKIHITEDPVSQDIAYYSIGGSASSEDNSEDENILTFSEKGVYGIDTSLIYKSAKPTRITLSGFGFEKEDKFRCELDGKLDYGADAVKCEFVNKNTVTVIIPGGIACGKYKVKISIGELKANIEDGLTVVAQGSEKLTEFGPYVFTSYEKTENDGVTVLSSAVNLNGWLNFRGEVILEKTGDEREIKMIDEKGSYVQYFEGSATGLSKIMAKKGIKLPIEPLGEVILVNDPTINAESEDYPVNAVELPFIYFADALSFSMPGISLYPNRIVLKSNEFSTKFPGQDDMLKAGGIKDIFKFKIEVDGIVTNKTIGVKGEFSNKPDDDKKSFTPANFGKTKLMISPLNFKVKIDTVENNYSVDLGVKLDFIKQDDDGGLGVYAEWKSRETDKGLEHIVPHEFMIKASYPIHATIGPVPVTYSDFKVGLSDIDPNKKIRDWKLKGQFDLSTAKVSEMVPGLKDYIDDPAVMQFDDTTIELSFGQMYFMINAELKFLEQITIGKAKIEAGKIPVTSWLLGLENDDAYGLRAEVFTGIDWHIPNCDFKVGATLVLHAHSKFAGIEAEGDANVTIKWLIFKAKFKETGTGVIGLQFDGDLPTFVIKIAMEDDNGTNGYYLMWNKRTNLDYGKLEV